MNQFAAASQKGSGFFCSCYPYSAFALFRLADNHEWRIPFQRQISPEISYEMILHPEKIREKWRVAMVMKNLFKELSESIDIDL
jgi:hypothetical protein